ncbi:tRNA (adenine-N1)-methyltransferase [Corynebacterium sp. TAE3-ERU12]|uniref:tRNA (adenine-N1)-methyltransferase n=1 Tax=Corynebacterium sp. TAE3-ERU12 TaxID=2849491 RepID=UPI001C49114C|nr:tRNA (adenine-N1)-methyltransferase [Corynebacterium sp. TAE3-ERU12]MBV7295466.1 tRNA (adenine-N1)-methyltransferase [Corynebacterium sp. TAE3-ERU12]
MAHSGPFHVGDRVQLTDGKNRKFTITLKPGERFFTHRGPIAHDDIIGSQEGTTVVSGEGTVYLAQRHTLVDYVLSMPRGAAVIYPKDASQILVEGDVFPGARVLEAGAGSGAMSLYLLRAIGPSGKLISYEIREDHLEHAERNVSEFSGGHPDNWDLRLGDLREVTPEDCGGTVDRVLLDMLEPWTCLEAAKNLLEPGGMLIGYVATVTQLMKVMEGIRELGCFTEPRAWETMVRDWHVVDLAVRPVHRMQAHTAFVLTARRLADGTVAPRPQRRNRR